MEMKAGTDPESTFIASACECGVAVQGVAHVLSSYVIFARLATNMDSASVNVSLVCKSCHYRTGSGNLFSGLLRLNR